MSYFSIAETNDSLHCWGRDKDGDLYHDVIPLSDTLYAFIKDNTGKAEHFSIYGDPLKKVYFEDKKSRHEYSMSRECFESDVRPMYHYLIDHYSDCDVNAPYNICYFDIEVDFDLEDGRGYPTPSNPFGEINSIQCFDTLRQKYFMFIPSFLKGTVWLEKDKEGYPVEIVWCRNEREILRRFAEYLEPVDILTAWFGAGFDLPYVMSRAKLCFGEKEALRMFCRDDVPATVREYVNAYGEDAQDWTLYGRTHLDMMELFKKFHPGEKKSFSLDAVAEEELGEKKVEVEDDLGSLYRENPQKFYEYALQDARLLRLLDEKQQVIGLAMMMARMSCAHPKDVTGTVVLIESGFMKFCRQKGNIVLPDRKENSKEKFDGAIVYDTLEGRHEWVMTVDLTGLYPHTMMMLGLSMENWLFQCKNGYIDYINIMTRSDSLIQMTDKNNDEVLNIEAKHIHDWIREEGLTISANGSIFSGSMGLLSEYVQSIVDTRKKYQKMKRETSDAPLIALYDLWQQVFKILGNSLYGCIGNASFRLFHIDLAKSVTLTGQVISKWQCYKANALVEELKEA